MAGNIAELQAALQKRDHELQAAAKAAVTTAESHGRALEQERMARAELKATLEQTTSEVLRLVDERKCERFYKIVADSFLPFSPQLFSYI